MPKPYSAIRLHCTNLTSTETTNENKPTEILMRVFEGRLDSLRILHIYSGNLFGGIETMLVTLARYRHLCPGVESHFALSFEGRLSKELRETGVPIYPLGNVRVRQPWSVWWARRALQGILQKMQFDAVICHSTWPQAIFGPVVRNAKQRLIFWLHNPAEGKHWLERWASRSLPDVAICNSHFTATSLSYLYPQTPKAVIYCPVAMPNVIALRTYRPEVRLELNTPPEAVVIIQTSRLEWWKGQSLHLEALGKLKNLPNWICWQVGGVHRPQEARYLQSLKEQAVRLGIEGRVRFLGQRSDVARLLAAADIHCQPNTGPEPFGIAFIEALLSKLPVVTTDIGAAKEIVDKTCGILVPPDDMVALANALAKLICDADLRSQLGNNGPSRAQMLCDPSRIMTDLFRLLTENSRQGMTN